MRVLIVIPHYGSDEYLARLLSTLNVPMPPPTPLREAAYLTAPFASGEIYIVNNNLRNRGFTRGSNEGIRFGFEKGFSCVWLLNNDTEVRDSTVAIRAFEREFDEHPETGVIGCKIVWSQDHDFIHHAGGTVAYPRGVHKTGRVSAKEYSVRSLEKWVTGASMVISYRCLAEVGTLDEGFFNYASDSDYCYRARARGFEVVYLPVPIVHAVGQSSDPSPLQRRILERDTAHFREKWISGEQFLKLDELYKTRFE